MATRSITLTQNTPYSSTMLLVGRVVAKPDMDRDERGDFAIILLHAAADEHSDIASGFPVRAYGNLPRTLACGLQERPPATLCIRVRGYAAQGYAASLLPGALLLAEVRVLPLATGEGGTMLTAFEAGRIHQLDTTDISIPYRTEMPPPVTNSPYAHPVSMRTN